MPGGLAAFSLEVGDQAPFALGEGMRYRHAPAHAVELARSAGFAALSQAEVILREERGSPVRGMLLVLR